MCGIAGFVSRNPRASDPIRDMTELAKHRGPDDEGYLLVTEPGATPTLLGGDDTPATAYQSGTPFAPAVSIGKTGTPPVVVAFGHRRLSIVDVSVLGHQPMCTPDRRYWIVYNGEIYNYRELGAELQSLGHTFISRSDTEVILAAYAQWGADCLHRFNGMWAFAIYDAQARELFAARDRFGIKPLYYWMAPGDAFCFASEIKQFTAVPGWNATINAQRAYDFLAWGMTDHTDETMFSGVFQLRAGECLSIPTETFSAAVDGRVQVRRWYDLQPAAFHGSFDEAAAECRRLLTDSVRLMLRADVPVGSCLSGGIDSSSIVCVMNELLRGEDASDRQQTFSACAEVERYDERSWVDEVVRATGVGAHYVYPGLDRLLAESGRMTWHQDEPYGSTSIFAQWSVFQLAAEHGLKVMLDGQGADEAFGGYHSFFGPYVAGLLQSAGVSASWKEVRRTMAMHGRSEREGVRMLLPLLLPAGVVARLRSLRGAGDRAPSWLNLSALNATARDPLAASDRHPQSLQAMSMAQIRTTNLQMLLHWEDRNSMAHSVESRVPFLDHRLVEFALGLPDEFKLAGGVTKRVLRRAMSGILPDRIRDRVDKMAFVTPEEVWMRENGGVAFRARLHAAVEASRGILGSESLGVLDEMIRGSRPFGHLPWRLIAFGEWMTTFALVSA